jgi:hypothetical protein
MRQAGCVAALCAALSGCGYVGDPLPPTLDIPQPVTDLRAFEYGDRVIAAFTLQEKSTEGLVLKRLDSVDLYVAPAGATSIDQWAAQAKRYPLATPKAGPLEHEIPATDWVGRDVEMRVRAVGPKGRASAWSNLVTLHVIDPLLKPANVTAKNVKAGVLLTWEGRGPGYRVFRTSSEMPPTPLADTAESTFTDQTTIYGMTYRYQVQALASPLQQGILTDPVSITPVDVFAPDVPAGLSGLAATMSIELAWQPSTDEDFAAYTLYRGVDGGPMQPLTTSLTTPAYSDRQVEPGKRYRYALSAADMTGNQSAVSSAIEVVAQ